MNGGVVQHAAFKVISKIERDAMVVVIDLVGSMRLSLDRRPDTKVSTRTDPAVAQPALFAAYRVHRLCR